jgi:DNA-binding NarL/FixJ family response regulator
MALKLAIFEDNTALRTSLCALFEEVREVEVVGDYADCRAPFPEQVVALRPDVVLMDVNMPGSMDGIAATALLKNLLPDTQVVILTVLEDEDIIFNALSAGATGYLLKQTSSYDIVEGVLQVHRGESPITPAIARKVLNFFKQQSDPTPPPGESVTTPAESFGLSTREQDILDGLVEGLSYKMIAGRYFISTDTVRNHIQNIYKKMHVNSKGEAIRKALLGSNVKVHKF